MNHIPFIFGSSVDLCVMDKKIHLKKCLEWINNPIITKYLGTGITPIYRHLEEKWFDDQGKDNSNNIFAIHTKEGKYIGNVGIHSIDWIHRRGLLGIIIGDKEEWGNGYAQEAESLIIKYAFQNLNLHKICAEIFENNIASQKAAFKNGFKTEGNFKQHLFLDGKYCNSIFVAILKEEWKQNK